MKATEIQIGDILNLSEVNSEIIPCKVVELHTDELLAIQPQYKACDSVGYDMIFPIPLTPEILEKNGWEKSIGENPVEVWAIKNGVYLHNTDNGYKLREGAEFNVPNIQYVHELQRVLRCCGLWELAEKFKI